MRNNLIVLASHIGYWVMYVLYHHSPEYYWTSILYFSILPVIFFVISFVPGLVGGRALNRKPTGKTAFRIHIALAAVWIVLVTWYYAKLEHQRNKHARVVNECAEENLRIVEMSSQDSLDKKINRLALANLNSFVKNNASTVHDTFFCIIKMRSNNIKDATWRKEIVFEYEFTFKPGVYHYTCVCCKDSCKRIGN